MNILYQDNHLLAVYKPPGIPLQPGRSGTVSLMDLTRARIKTQHGKPGNVFLGLVHRLDQPVAGLVLFAKTSKAASRLSRQFREKTPKKIYRAVVEGTPDPPTGNLIHYLRKEKSLKATVFPRSAPGAKRAELSYTLIETLEGGSLLEVDLLTGRFHQIRAQLAFTGHPILGDVKYGASSPLPGRLIALYAWKLIIRHPISGEETLLESPAPPGWPFL